jgi:poly-gamma-glutamate synthesis protein (capsule biosynthesis protein)
MHSGTEYVANPNARQVAFARAAVDAGADMVIGHHPHVVQTAEKYEGKWIFYSLGNFIFDQMWSQQTREGLGLKVFFQENAVLRIELMPVLIADYAQPAPYGGPAADKLVARLGVPVEKVGGNGYVLAEP